MNQDLTRFVKHVRSVSTTETDFVLQIKAEEPQEVTHHCVSAGDQRHGDPGTDPQRAGPYDGDPADLSPVEGQQQPLHQTEPPHLLAAL